MAAVGGCGDGAVGLKPSPGGMDRKRQERKQAGKAEVRVKSSYGEGSIAVQRAWGWFRV